MRYRIIDIDNCISDDGHRRHLARAGKWDEYHEKLDLDEPVNTMLLLGLPDDVCVCFFTAAPKRWHDQRHRWIKAAFPHLCNRPIKPRLYMRQDNDRRSAVEVKRTMLLDLLSSGAKLDEITLAVDDREDILQMYREFGITTLKASADGARGRRENEAA